MAKEVSRSRRRAQAIRGQLCHLDTRALSLTWLKTQKQAISRIELDQRLALAVQMTELTPNWGK
jgi:hypothetical protein